MIWGQLGLNLAVIVAVMLLLWRYAVAIRDVSFIDIVWAWGMVLLAGHSALMAAKHGGISPTGWLVLGVTAIWGLRLGTHLLLRWRRLGPDPRYIRIMASLQEKRGWGFAKAALIQVFLLQGPLLWFVCLPAQIGILVGGDAAIGGLALAGLGLAATGIIFESIGDAQLEAFRKNPASHGQVLNTGLWRYTRHPNYFGDACAWWGIWLIAISAGAPIWTIASPVSLTWTLMKWSGAPMLEKGLKRSRPGYADYVARTSGFFPLPPK